MLLLALVMVPLLLLPLVGDFPEGVERLFLAADWFIWAAFAVDYGVKFAVAPRRIQYVRDHPLEGAMVVLPFLRPLRLARFLRLARAATALGINVTILRDLARQRGTKLMVAAVLGCLVAGAGGVFFVERDERGANIQTFGDAIWWAATTMTTVGYGDFYPVTDEGRGIAVALMLFGIASLTALTATIAAMLVREHEEVDRASTADLADEIRALRGEVEKLRDTIETERGID
ncbi:potassium channel family protein [Candidatus Amarobacter glycogenicus]|uniref:potassium channel family protein n=1 Tax=Candidatus Amarobacter glycogenicus TaxID=3140699 RepID=UPI002A0CA094|nr:potassium channel family protein [Dehalococcoidia bacterium]MBK9612195.1 potassium channel family protein [Dehalococcoidia bacterium]